MLKTPLSIFLLALAALVAVHVVKSYVDLYSTPHFSEGVIDWPTDPVTKAALDSTPNDSLPYYRYRHIRDSLDWVASRSNPFRTGDGMSFFGVGIYASGDTARSKRFIAIDGCHKDHDTKFFFHQGAAHLLYIQWDSSKTGVHSTTNFGRYASKPVHVGFEESANKLLIPISRRTHDVLHVMGSIWFYLSLVIFLLAFLVYPYRILSSIARGDAFNEQNPRYFKRLSLLVVFFAALDVFIPLVVALLYNNLIPPEIDLHVIDRFTKHIPTMIVATALWLLGEAFSRGGRLQQFEQTMI